MGGVATNSFCPASAGFLYTILCTASLAKSPLVSILGRCAFPFFTIAFIVFVFCSALFILRTVIPRILTDLNLAFDIPPIPLSRLTHILDESQRPLVPKHNTKSIPRRRTRKQYPIIFVVLAHRRLIDRWICLLAHIRQRSRMN